MKTEQTEPAKTAEDESSDESTIDEQTAVTLKDIYCRAGFVEYEENDEDEMVAKVKEEGEDSWEMEDEEERRALKRPKPCNRPQVKARKIKIEDDSETPTVSALKAPTASRPPNILTPRAPPISAPRVPNILAHKAPAPKLSSQLTSFKIPKKVVNQNVHESWDLPLGIASPIKTDYVAAFQQFTGLKPNTTDWTCTPANGKLDSSNRRKQQFPKFNRNGIDDRDLSSNL